MNRATLRWILTNRARTVRAVRVLLRRDAEILMMRRAGTGYRDGQWEIPGGRVEAGESLPAAAARELAEETGVVVRPDQLSVRHVMHRTDDLTARSYRTSFLVAREWTGVPCIAEPSSCCEMAWFPIGALPEDTIPWVADGIRASR